MKQRPWLFGAPICIACLPLGAQDAKALEDELLALLNTPVTVASQKAMTTREAPGIVSLITREEILASGARDLIDVLRLVPGFDFASDIQGVVGVAVRGNWAFEGKLLLLVDGQELNETRYGTTQFGNHVPIDQIRQIEIIRGPGSAIYGGFAELAVVNIKTRDGADLRGFSGGINYGATSRSTTQRTANLAYGQVFGDLNLSLSASAGDGQRTEEAWNAFGDARNLEDRSTLRQGFYNLGLDYRGFTFRALRDDYEPDDFTFYRRPDTVSRMRFAGTYLEAKYAWSLSNTLKLTPRLSWKQQEPWYYPDELPGGKKKTERTTVGIQGSWDATDALNVIFGADAWKDEGRTPEGTAWSNGETSISYDSRALYGQALWRTDLGNFTVGARYDHNSQFGSSFVPRFAFTKVWGSYHLKLLASKAFRAPSIENFELNPDVEPEKTTALEMEFGAQFGKVFVSVNLFDLSMKNPIVYQYDAGTGAETYYNYPGTGTRGAELDFQYRSDWGWLRSSLTFSQAQDNRVPDFSVPGESAYMVGLANVKATFAASLKLTPRLSFSPTMVAIGPRYTFESAGGPVRREATALVNAMLHYRFPARNLLLTAGVHNLTGAQVGFPKAYQGTDGDTYPSQPRDFFVRLGFNY